MCCFQSRLHSLYDLYINKGKKFCLTKIFSYEISLDYHYTFAVPDSAIGVMSEVFGTADIRISWSMPDPLTLRGSDQTFYVQIFSNGTLQGEVQVDGLSVFLHSSVGVVNGRVQNIAVSYMYSVGN